MSVAIIKSKLVPYNNEKLIVFLNQWEADFMFVDIARKPACLIHPVNVAVIKELNQRQHFETKPQDKLKHLNAEQKLQISIK